MQVSLRVRVAVVTAVSPVAGCHDLGRYMTPQKPIIVAFKMFMGCLVSPGSRPISVTTTYGRSIPSAR
jgi:hypothetical protein